MSTTPFAAPRSPFAPDATPRPITPSAPQFSFGSLMEFVTISSILLALSPATGVVATLFLILFGLSLAARWGIAALAMFAAALLSVGANAEPLEGGVGVLQQILVILSAATLCAWYRLRHALAERVSRRGD